VSDDLLMKLKFDVYNTSQNLVVMANGYKIFEGVVSGKESPLEIYFPRALVNEELLLKFMLPDAISPSELGLSGDRRKLGLAFKEIRFTYSDQARVGVGESVTFHSENSTSSLTFQGWGNQESNHRWTEGSKASLRFRLDDYKSHDLVLRLNATGYLGGGLENQKIDVNINDTHVARWEMIGQSVYKASVPAGLVSEDGKVSLVFDISDPTAPCEVGESIDCRKLGMAVKDLVIDYAK